MQKWDADAEEESWQVYSQCLGFLKWQLDRDKGPDSDLLPCQQIIHTKTLNDVVLLMFMQYVIISFWWKSEVVSTMCYPGNQSYLKV